jgi:hypothetical protein
MARMKKSAIKRYSLMDARFYKVREDELGLGGYRTDQGRRDFKRMIGVVGATTSYRVLFTTVEKYMGLAPLTARIGGVIFLSPRADVPFVLRHVRGGEYEVVG